MTLEIPRDDNYHAASEPSISLLVRRGQGFSSNFHGATATNNNLVVCSLSLFNPTSSGKTILIFSLKTLSSTIGTGALHSYSYTASDPSGGSGFTGVPTVQKIAPAGSIASVASVSSTASGATSSITPTGTVEEEYQPAAGVSTELLTNGLVIPLGPGNGIEVINVVGTAGGFYQAAVKWVEH